MSRAFDPPSLAGVAKVSAECQMRGISLLGSESCRTLTSEDSPVFSRKLIGLKKALFRMKNRLAFGHPKNISLGFDCRHSPGYSFEVHLDGERRADLLFARSLKL